MRTSILSTLNRYLQHSRRWYEQTPERALERAYDAALMIKSIEDEHFDGKPISLDDSKYSANANSYFQSELKKYLKITEIRLSEFRASRYIFNTTDPSANARSDNNGLASREQGAVILEKLKFIDEILERYKIPVDNSLSLVPVTPSSPTPSFVNPPSLPANGQRYRQVPPADAAAEEYSDGPLMDKTGVLPRSLAGTLSRIKRDLDPNSEREMVQNFRQSKAKTLISIRFLLLLIIIPLLTQQISKAVLVGPIVDRLRSSDKTEIFLNFELEEEALHELQAYKERLEFDFLLGRMPLLGENPASAETAVAAENGNPSGAIERPSGEGNPPAKRLTKAEQEEQIEGLLKEKAKELQVVYNRESSDAIKNVFADVLSLVAFGIVVVTNRPEIAVLKSFIDNTVYGLSDSAKAFIIILFTDMFVGFHSPHGWEVLLEGVARHWGLPANHDFIFLFIATFPVILDTIFKYWIFRYLNRISPSAVATYKNMNET